MPFPDVLVRAWTPSQERHGGRSLQAGLKPFEQRARTLIRLHPPLLQRVAVADRDRVVLERLQTSSNTSDRRILFQLEFNGFSKVGGSSLQSIQANVPKYQYLREEVVQPNRFQQYD